MRISKNDAFESVKIESVRVDRHPQYKLGCDRDCYWVHMYNTYLFDATNT